MVTKKVDRQAVVEAALEVLEDQGLSGLTVRSIAARLGIQNPGLYWHFRGKQEIVDAMAARMLVEANLTPEPDANWRDWLPEMAARFRRTMLSHRDGSHVIASADLSASPLQDATAATISLLVDAGIPPRTALIGVLAVLDYTLGATFEEQADGARKSARRREPEVQRATPASLSAFAGGPFTSDDAFEGGFQLLVEGLAARLNERR